MQTMGIKWVLFEFIWMDLSSISCWMTFLLIFHKFEKKCSQFTSPLNNVKTLHIFVHYLPISIRPSWQLHLAYGNDADAKVLYIYDFSYRLLVLCLPCQDKRFKVNLSMWITVRYLLLFSCRNPDKYIRTDRPHEILRLYVCIMHR